MILSKFLQFRASVLPLPCRSPKQRNYRRRKKEYFRELEAKLYDQEEELKKLREEVAVLKNDTFEAIDPAMSDRLEELKQIVEKLDAAVKNNVDDTVLQYLLQVYYCSLEKRHIAMIKDFEKLVNPLTQAKLATMGYTPALENFIVSYLSGPKGDEWWAVFDQEAYLTEEQKHLIKSIRDRYWKLDEELREQRVVIDKNIKVLFLQKIRLVPNLRDLHSKFVSGSSASKLDIEDVFHIAEQLKHLKKNFTAQYSLMFEQNQQFGRVLTLRQHAILLLRFAACRTFDWPSQAVTLCSAWRLFGKDNAE